MRTFKTPDISEGEGLLTFSGFHGPVAWRVEGAFAKLRLGPTRLKGAITTTAETAHAAFRAGDGRLTLDGGDSYRLTMVGHTFGSREVFVEVRV